MNDQISNEIEEIRNAELISEDTDTTCSLNTFLLRNNLEQMYQTAIDYFGHKMTFKELKDNIWRTARALVKIGVRPGEVVTVCSEMTPELIYLFYAMDLMGAVPNLINLHSQKKEINQEIQKMESRVVICIDSVYSIIQKAVVGTLVGKVIVISATDSMKGLQKIRYKFQHKLRNQYDANVIFWQDFLWLGMDPLDELSVVGYVPERVACMADVSKTERESRKALISTQQFNALALKAGEADYDENGRYLCTMPPSFTDGLIKGMHAPLSHGICLVIAPEDQELEEKETIFAENIIESPVSQSNEIIGEEIENIISKHENVKEFVAVRIADSAHPESCRPFVFVKWHDESLEARKKSITEVKELCEKYLSASDLPIGYVSVKNIPITDTGDADLKKLREQAEMLYKKRKQ